MKRVLTKLRKMTMIAGGANQLQYEKAHVISLITEAVQFSHPQASQKGVEILILHPENNFIVQVDREVFIFQILMNFLTNAIKFTPAEKSVVISVEEKKDGVSIQIRDQGVGIEPHRLKKILSWKGQNSTLGTNGERGTGLGLPIAQRFLHFMGGQISIESYPATQYPLDHGTVVTINLPLASVDKQESFFTNSFETQGHPTKLSA